MLDSVFEFISRFEDWAVQPKVAHNPRIADPSETSVLDEDLPLALFQELEDVPSPKAGDNLTKFEIEQN